MTENEQIQEMASILFELCHEKDDCSLIADCEMCRAERLYAKGCRKVERGEWIPRNYTRHCSCGKSERVVHYECSVCKRIAYNQPYGLSFCPNCGADMRGEENEG